jgi:PRTRC genetic system ThiF family protein
MARAKQLHAATPYRWVLEQNVYLANRTLEVVLVGVGGTGSEVLSNLVYLHLGLRALGHHGLRVTAIDPDTVSPSNIVRQRFSPSDVGRNKAIALCDRINIAYPEISFNAIPKAFSESREAFTFRGADILISCVDSRKARAEIDVAVRKSSFAKIWIDTGCSATRGQVILGTRNDELYGNRRNKPRHMLPLPSDVHPELVDTAIAEDDAPSCSAMESLRTQDLFINKRVALAAVDLLWELLHTGGLTHHGVYFDLRARSEAPLAIAPPLAPMRRRRKAAA